MKVSVVIITYNEEANLGRTLSSVAPLMSGGNGELIIVDSGSTDRTCEIARDCGAKVFREEWKGFAAQKNSAIAKATTEWILSLDADEEVSPELAREILDLHGDAVQGFYLPRRNMFLGRWIRHGGFYPDRKLRLFRRGAGKFEERLVHENLKVEGATRPLSGNLIHHAYPTLAGYIEHMNRYSSLGSQLAASQGQTGRTLPAFLWNVWLRPQFTFLYNYLVRLGFLDGREGLLLHLYHAVYVSWKYAKAWERTRKQQH